MDEKQIAHLLKSIVEYISKSFSTGLIVLILFMALLGLMIFSLPAISKDNFEFIYFFIGTAITLSGFTMLSGIFEKTETDPIVKRLFLLSIIFLFSAFSCILCIGLYSGSKYQQTQPPILNNITVGTYFLGIFLFFTGFAFLIFVLIQHYKQICKNGISEK
jgi:hypothetical protein